MLILFWTLLLSVSLSSAGPACTRKYFKTAQCIEKCKNRWGFPGTMMGSNPWGQVMQVVDDSSKEGWDAVIAEACGMTSSSSKGKFTDDDGPEIVGNLDDDEPEETSIEDEAVSSTTTRLKTTASPSVFRTASSSSTSSKSSTRAPKPTEEPKDEPTPPKTTPKPTPTKAPDSGNPTQGGDIGAYLKAHNDVRSRHGASPLTWSDKLASAAQKWANNCKFVHSGGSVGPFGENLSAGTGSGFGISRAIELWANEAPEYRASAPVASHFTQMVWKDTKQVGCALALCDGIFDADQGKARFFVCEYDPPGNVSGDFARNVQV